MVRGPRVRGLACGLAAAAALLVLTLAPAAAAARIPLDLRLDGQPLEPIAPPDLTCFSATPGRWVSCGAKRGEGPGDWVLEGLEPGRYRLHVSIDENPANPRRFPGDYEAQLQFEVIEGGPARLVVDVARLIHLTRPGDNARAMEGTTQGLAQNLSRLLSEAGRHDEAVTVCRRLIDERGAEVSPYKLAETWDRIAWAHWEKGERSQALEAVREVLAKYGETVRGDDLRRTLAHFEREK